MSRPTGWHRAAADVAIFTGLFNSVAEHMGITLVRSAFSPNIKERRDCSCALFDASGVLVAQAAHIPVHLGAMPASVDAALRAYPRMSAGDAVLLNDPFSGGTHLPDLTLVTPVFNRGRRPVAYLASRAHHADVGGMTPGSLPPSTEIYQEGVRIPPVLIRRAGRWNEAVVDILCAGSRTPTQRAGDLHAQVAAHETGARRLDDIIGRYGAATVTRRFKALQEYAARLMGGLIERIPNGTYRFTDHLDDDGHGSGPLAIKVTIRVAGRAARVDFTGTAPACRGNLNAVEAITASATYYCFLVLMVRAYAERHGLGQLPINAGCFAPIDLVVPAGSLVAAQLPSAVACGNLETSQRIVDTVFGALAAAVPQWVPAAGQGTMNNVTLGGTDPRTSTPFSYYETLAGGMGAHAQGAGADAVQVHMTNTLNTPVEAFEFAYPMRVECYALRPRSGGGGLHRGGHGIRRDIRMLCRVTGTVMADRRTTAPYGLAGGAAGARGRQYLVRKGRRRSLPSKTGLELEAGDVLSILTPGGGGWGRLRQRSTS